MVTFNRIPSGIKTPGVYVENDSSQASGGAQEQNALIIGVYAGGNGGRVDPDTLHQVVSLGSAADMFGVDSPLYHQIQRYRQNAPAGPMYAIGVRCAVGTAATGTWTVTGTATGAGTIYVYAGDRPHERVPVDVDIGDDQTAVAAAIEAALNAATLYVEGKATLGVMMFGSLWDGAMFHDMRMDYNVRGAVAGEVMPSGISIARTTNIGETVAGAGTISIANAITAMGSASFDFIDCGINDVTNLALLDAALNDTDGRWSYTQQIYGHAFAGYQGTQSELTTYGAALDTQHLSILPVEGQNDTAGGNFDPLSMTPSWAWGAGFMGTVATANMANPARPYKSLEAVGNMAPAVGDRFSPLEIETLLDDGIATVYYTPSGGAHIGRLITTYLTDAVGNPDESYLDYTTPAKLTTINRELILGIGSKFPRAVLVDEVPAGAPGDGTFIDPVVIAGYIAGLYLGWEARGLVEDSDGFIDEMTVTRNSLDPNRVDAYLPSRLSGSLLITALLNSFRFTTS